MYDDLATCGCAGAMCIIPIIIWIIMAIWVYKDAEKRGKSGALWFIIVLLTGIIGLIIWLVVRPKQTAGVGYGPPVQPYQPPYQPFLTREREKEIITREIVKIPCKYCGTLVEITAAKCPGCGAELK